MQLTTRMLAAGGTVAGLGALAAIAMAAGGDPATEAQTVTPVAAPPQVRTEVVRTTVHVTKRERPKTAASVTPATPAPAAQRAVTTSAAPSAVVPVTQRARVDDDGEDGDDHGGDRNRDERDEAGDDHDDDRFDREDDDRDRDEGEGDDD